MTSSFSRASKDFDNHAAVLRELGRRLCERLDYIKMVPETILDLGTATGASQLLLAERYPNAQVIGLDRSFAMLSCAAKKTQHRHKSYLVQADTLCLPFATHSIDLIFSNMLLPWVNDVASFFNECSRILKPQGLVLFNSLGPDSLLELKQLWKQQDSFDHVNPFIDLHDVGDAALAAGLCDPALDVEHLSIGYASVREAIYELKSLGSVLTHGRSKPGLTTPAQLTQLETWAVRDTAGLFPVTLEIVYGVAWGSEISMRNQRRGNEILLPVAGIKRTLS